MLTLHTHFLPQLVEPQALAGAAVVVIDVLRATTTIVHALAAGAREVRPCLEIDEARQLAASYPAGETVLGGERQGVRIEGFDLGNSPTEYTPERVRGRTVVFTTTNGTRAMMRCREARRVLVGALVNRRAVAAALAGEDQVHCVCAGTHGEITREDVLLAGSLAELLTAAGNGADWTLNDEARLALDAWCVAFPAGSTADDLTRQLAETQGGRNLVAEGFTPDIATAALLDAFAIVPHLDVQNMVIR